jgi:hypothetical protein
MRMICLCLCLFLEASCFASSFEETDDEEDFSFHSCDSGAEEDSSYLDSLTWDHLARTAVGCLDNESRAPVEEPLQAKDQTSPHIPVLHLTGMEHDLQAVNKPSFLYFKAGEHMSYRLSDVDGGATFSLLYAMCMSDVRRSLAGLRRNKASKRWNCISQRSIDNFEIMRFLLKHNVSRFMTAHDGDNTFDLASLDRIITAIRYDDMTYSKLYHSLGTWLATYYDKLPPYMIEVTDSATQKGWLIKGIMNNGASPIGDTLRSLCHMATFERALDFDEGVHELSYDLKMLMLAYNLRRGSDQNLWSDYHEERTIHQGPNRVLTVTISYIPIAPDPKVAVPRNQIYKEVHVPPVKMHKPKKADKGQWHASKKSAAVTTEQSEKRKAKLKSDKK